MVAAMSADFEKNLQDTASESPKGMTKRELWESKLLDLSTHNMLLNFQANAGVEPILSGIVDELEDALADGHEFRLLPVSTWTTDIINSNKSDDSEASCDSVVNGVSDVSGASGDFDTSDASDDPQDSGNEKIRQELRNHRLYTAVSENQLDRDLTRIYRAARSSREENGVSSLYLAVGMLKWFVDAECTEPCFAPLVLIPVEIVRKSANQGYAFHERDEEPHFNTTLLEMLRQNYNLEIPGVDPLPLDEHGIDIRKTFELVRAAISPLNNWEAAERCVIGNFSFARFAIWNDIHTAGAMLDESKIVRSLMKGYVDWDIAVPKSVENTSVQTAAEDTPALTNDDNTHTFLPLTVDATQLKAINMAAQGTTFVLHGPPGTGKSQTITGMIANLIAQGKRVLFVAEKMAALSVVQKRLASLGLDAFCLELHSDKASKKQVLTLLENALNLKYPPLQSEYEEVLRKMTECRQKLDEYPNHLHEIRKCGYSLRQLIDLFETVRDSQEYVIFDKHEAARITGEQMKTHLPLLGQLTAAGEVIGNIPAHPLKNTRITSFDANVREAVPALCQAYIDSITAAQEQGNQAVDILQIEAPKNKADLAQISTYIDLFDDGKGIAPVLVSLLNCDTSEAQGYFENVRAVQAMREELLRTWNEHFLDMDMSAVLEKHEEAGRKLFFLRGNAMDSVTAEVQNYAKTGITYEQIPGLIDRVIHYQKQNRELQQHFSSLSEDVQALLKQLPTEEAYNSASEEALQRKQRAAEFPGGLDAILKLVSMNDSEENNSQKNDIGKSESGKKDNENQDSGKKDREKKDIEKIFSDFRLAFTNLTDAEKALNTLLRRRAAAKTNKWFETETEFCRYLMQHTSDLKDWALYNQVREECVKVGILPAVQAYEDGMSAGILETAYKKGIYYALISSVIGNDDVLSSFSGATFNQSVQNFKILDDQMLRLTKQEIFHVLASRIPTAWDSAEIGAELNLLRKAISNNSRGMSIRSLFERISHILPALCPCMLMSPNSVAQYLAQDGGLFDIVIFDEASQLPTCKAIGALARAKDAVIVGDPKQMPPTTFFAGAGPEMDDPVLDDLDSILDDALALGIPSRHLQWHYRSTHESLIAFSNHEFYENKMYTFPSANDRERHVTAVHVDGVYSENTNIKEAEAVVGEVVRRFLDPELRSQSVGIVTFNVVQQTLIENLLAKQFQNDPELDRWANEAADPLFVKNLENVQGDERDVILFSIGYGPDEKGHISMNFGPINKPGGGKRLNVAFSRSRVTMTIYESLYSSDIRITDSSPDGLVAFRDFLKYAEGQDIRTKANAEAEEKLATAGILQNICRTLKEQGYQCETMVGHSDFHIDIAVVDPFDSDHYILGILLDGDTYRQTENTRDREIAQISVLNHLGWNLVRVWTMDWWDKREWVLKKLLEQLAALKTESEKQAAEKQALEDSRRAEEAAREAEAARIRADLGTQVAEVIDEAVQNVLDFVVSEYAAAELPVTPLETDTYTSAVNQTIIRERITEVLNTEAPILKDVLYRSVWNSFSVSRSSAVMEATDKALKTLKIRTTRQQGNVFCWAKDQDPKEYRGIRVSSSRTGEEICLQEIKNAVCYVLKTKGNLDKEDLIKETSRVFGYKRLGKNLEAALAAGVQAARTAKLIEQKEDGKLGLAEQQGGVAL